DNQEVYQDCTEKTGAVLVVEILEYQSDVSNGDAASFFFRDLAESNGCSDADCALYSSTVFSLCNSVQHLFENIKQSFMNVSRGCCIILVGSQKVVQGKDVTSTHPSTRDAPKCIGIEMCILRLEQAGTDLLITLSTPSDSISTRSSQDGNSRREQSTVGDAFLEIVSAFRIQDWSLFG
ncbi:hypothetical protein ACHAWX_005508, partial [Stephanocyclus meneghinianus]